MVNRGFSLIVCGLSERISAMTFVFHCPSVRRSCNALWRLKQSHLPRGGLTESNQNQSKWDSRKKGVPPQVQN
jgi:hypothetical protein